MAPLSSAPHTQNPTLAIPFNDLNTVFNHTHIPVYLLADLNAKHRTFYHNRNNTYEDDLFTLYSFKHLNFQGPDFHTLSDLGGKGRPDFVFSNSASKLSR